jgi:hypothetical protein
MHRSRLRVLSAGTRTGQAILPECPNLSSRIVLHADFAFEDHGDAPHRIIWRPRELQDYLDFRSLRAQSRLTRSSATPLSVRRSPLPRCHSGSYRKMQRRRSRGQRQTCRRIQGSFTTRLSAGREDSPSLHYTSRNPRLRCPRARPPGGADARAKSHLCGHLCGQRPFTPFVIACKLLKELVGASGFEPPASRSRTLGQPHCRLLHRSADLPYSLAQLVPSMTCRLLASYGYALSLLQEKGKVLGGAEISVIASAIIPKSPLENSPP